MTDREPESTPNQDTQERVHSRFLHDFGDWVVVHPDDQLPAEDAPSDTEA